MCSTALQSATCIDRVAQKQQQPHFLRVMALAGPIAPPLLLWVCDELALMFCFGVWAKQIVMSTLCFPTATITEEGDLSIPDVHLFLLSLTQTSFRRVFAPGNGLGEALTCGASPEKVLHLQCKIHGSCTACAVPAGLEPTI